MNFPAYFKKATGHPPYPYQEAFALGNELPSCLEVPTGAGKTAAVVLGWLWRRKHQPDITPRRLVYCLPMRVLVEQTVTCAQDWIAKLGLTTRIATLMGGQIEATWDLNPDEDFILIGTQDQLLSRALNRGYAMSRYRWPLHFGLVHNDSLWVLDELQLMGAGLTTSCQLEAFRRKFECMVPSSTLWMSATIRREWLETIDLKPDTLGETLGLSTQDRSDERLAIRLNARKPIAMAESKMGEAPKIAAEVLKLHKAGTRTLVVVNTVKRAGDLYEAVQKAAKKQPAVLLHSRFRPADRQRALKRAMEEPGPDGIIVIATQVVEAGLDISSRLLVTELAPWSSLVQRFGRCNRDGLEPDAQVLWLEQDSKVLSLPYEQDALDKARHNLVDSYDVGPTRLPELKDGFEHGPMLRSRDLFELFDTTPDLAGFDLDVSRFIRNSDDTDVQAYWREVADGPEPREPKPARAELCSVPIGEMKKHLSNHRGWFWDHVERSWQKAEPSRVAPGRLVLLVASEGGYLPDTGWTPTSKKPVLPAPQNAPPNEGYESDPLSESPWESVAEHTQRVVDQCTTLARLVPEPLRPSYLTAARWHDLGKAHSAFQACFRVAIPARSAPAAKAPKDAWKQGRPGKGTGDGRRRFFRHELASALAALFHGQSDLVAYLCACHHGKVRLSLRAMPDEKGDPEKADRRFARGVWHDDRIPEVDLGGGVIVPESKSDMTYMDLGEGDRGPSWLARCLDLLQTYGPFRLAFLEGLMKVGDERASAAAAPEGALVEVGA